MHIDLCYKESERAILKLSESSDAHLAGTATKLLGSMQDTRATDLLKLLADSGQRDQNVTIGNLGSTKYPRAVDTLLKIANDPEQQKGRQAELGEALSIWATSVPPSS